MQEIIFMFLRYRIKSLNCESTRDPLDSLTHLVLLDDMNGITFRHEMKNAASR